jgi:hypothetical protein
MSANPGLQNKQKKNKNLWDYRMLKFLLRNVLQLTIFKKELQ